MNSPIEVFSKWAKDGRDERMADGHANSVKTMLEFALKTQSKPFSFIDAGCGNGWVVRMASQHPLCKKAQGVDGSESMINKAKSLDSENAYHCTDLMNWVPTEKVDIIHSMEVFYYLPDPIALINHIASQWLNPGGRLIMGIDYYRENKPSESWDEDCGISIMTRLSEAEWVAGFNSAGLKNVTFWRVGAKDDWAGTLVVTGKLES